MIGSFAQRVSYGTEHSMYCMKQMKINNDDDAIKQAFYKGRLSNPAKRCSLTMPCDLLPETRLRLFTPSISSSSIIRK